MPTTGPPGDLTRHPIDSTMARFRSRQQDERQRIVGPPGAVDSNPDSPWRPHRNERTLREQNSLYKRWHDTPIATDLPEGINTVPKPVVSSKKSAEPSSLRKEVTSGIISGLLVGLAFFVGQIVVDNNSSDREHEREDRQLAAQNKIEADRNEQGILLENLRFVRGLSSNADTSANRPFRKLDLHGLELGGLSLSGADFRNASLKGTSFRNAQLAGADFSGADVEGADFTEADLTGAKFFYLSRDSNDSGKGPYSLADAKLDGATFSNIETWGDVNVSGSSFCGARFNDVDFSKAFMSAAKLDAIPPVGLTLPDLSNAGVELCTE